MVFLSFLSFWLNLSTIATCVFVILCAWLKYRLGYWKRRGIYSPQSSFPFGHLGPLSLLKASFGVNMETIYNNTKKHPCVGLFILGKKALLVNDLDLVKRVMLKDYYYFQGHGAKSDKHADPLAQHLFNLEGEEWKRLRTKMSPTFTTSKIKFMFETMALCAQDMLDFFEQDPSTEQSFGIKEIIAKFSTDIIGSCAFGIQMNSFKFPDAEFRQMGRKIISSGVRKISVDLLSFLAPEVIKNLKISTMYPEVTKFFTKIVPETIKQREEANIIRNDFLQLMINMIKKESAGDEDGLTMAEITAQAFVFFVAGFETSSTAASYAFLELAQDTAIQDKLRAEILREVGESGGKVTYEAVSKMTYLTYVVEESLRKYPVIPFHFRFCSQNYTLPETESVIEKGTLIVIPILGIQRDPEIFPDPLKFDPDRFSPENVAKRHQFASIPFGEGPRVCIGMRFGMLQVKLALLTIVMNFDISLSEKTQLPLVYNPKTIFLHSEGELFLKLNKRSVVF